MILDPYRVRPHHSVKRPSFVRHLARVMQRDGWIGRPILVELCETHIQGWTGSHRIVAARRAGILIPARSVDTERLSRAVVDDQPIEMVLGAYLYGLPEYWYDEDRAKFLSDIGDPAASLLAQEVSANESERKRTCSGRRSVGR